MTNYFKYILSILLLPVYLTAFSQYLVPVDTMGSGQLYKEDFESGGPGWTVSGGFQIGAPTSGPNAAHSGSNCAATNLYGNYINGGNYYLTSGSISIPASASNVELSFYEYHYTESGWDFTYVQVSTDGGSSWSTILGGRSGNFGGYNEQVLSLDSYIGQSIRLRFYLHTDGSVIYPGWYIDDVIINAGGVAITTRDVPTLFLLAADEIWKNDTLFTDYWSTQEPFVGDLILANFSKGDKLVIDSIYSNSPGLKVIRPAIDTIPSAFGLPVKVSYQPLTEGMVSDTLYIVTNDTASPFVIILQGEAYDAPLEPQPELSFNGEIVGPSNFMNPLVVIDSLLEPLTSTDIYIDFKLTNKGARPVDIADYYFKYGGNNAFDFDNWSSTYIEYGDTATITVTFNAQRSRRQVVAIAYEYYTRDGKRVARDHWISGQNSYRGTYLETSGPWSYAGPDSLLLDFGTVLVGTSEFVNYIWFKNLGSIPIDISMTIVGNDFKYQGENPLHLEPAQGSEEYDEGIVFTPSDSTGIMEGLLIFTHNDTTPGAIDTVYLRGKGYKLPTVTPVEPAAFTFYYQGNTIERDSVLEIDFGPVIINNEFKKVDFMVVNNGKGDGYINWEYLDNYFWWIDENGSRWNSRDDIYIEAGDSLKFGLVFDPDYGYIFTDWGEVTFEDNYRSIYFNLTGYGIERHEFLVRYWGNDISEYNSAEIYNSNGWEQEVEFTYTNLHESAVTIDSVILEGADATTSITSAGLPIELFPGETYSFTTSFDPTIPDGLHESLVRIYSTNLTEPVFVIYLDNIARGVGLIDLKLVSNNADYNYGSLDMGYVSSIDGSRAVTMRMYSTNGYDFVADSSGQEYTPSFFSYNNLPDNMIIPSGDSVDFTVTYTPRGVSGSNSDELYLYYTYNNYPGSYMDSYVLYVYGNAIDDRTQTPELTVNMNGKVIPNDGTISFGDAPLNYGIENVLLTLENHGVQYITISEINFSNPAFSSIDWGYDEFEVWYYGPEFLSLYFNPAISGLEEGTMTINSDDPSNPVYVINLNGTGTSAINSETSERISLYPNPADERVMINTCSDEQSSMKIYNSTGTIMLSDNIANGFIVDISDFESGIYFVEIYSGNKTQRLKLVVR